MFSVRAMLRSALHSRSGVARTQMPQDPPVLSGFDDPVTHVVWEVLEPGDGTLPVRWMTLAEARKLYATKPFPVSQTSWWRRLLRFLAQPCPSGTNGCWCRR